MRRVKSCGDSKSRASGGPKKPVSTTTPIVFRGVDRLRRRRGVSHELSANGYGARLGMGLIFGSRRSRRHAQRFLGLGIPGLRVRLHIFWFLCAQDCSSDQNIGD